MADKNFEEKTDWLGNKYYEDSETGERMTVESQIFGPDHIVVRDKSGNVTSTIEQGRDFITGQATYDVRSPSYDHKGSISNEYVPFLGDAHVQRDSSGGYQGTIDADIFSRNSSSSTPQQDRSSSGSHATAAPSESGVGRSRTDSSNDFAYGDYSRHYAESGMGRKQVKARSSERGRTSDSKNAPADMFDAIAGTMVFALLCVGMIWFAFTRGVSPAASISKQPGSDVVFGSNAPQEVEKAARHYFAAKQAYISARVTGNAAGMKRAAADMRRASQQLAESKRANAGEMR